MEAMSIGQVARRVGLETSTLRYYESIGLLPPAERVSGQRRYTADVLRWLAIIQVAKEAGFTLAEVRTLLDGFSQDVQPSARWKSLAREKLPEVEALILRAQGMKRILQEGLACDCLTLDECMVFVNGGDRRSFAPPSLAATDTIT